MAREITFFDASAGAVVTLKAGTKLTDMNITQTDGFAKAVRK